MPNRALWSACVVSAVAGALILVGGPAAAAATLATAVVIEDGTTPFDATPGAGFDTGASNSIVRTNDNVTFQLSVAPSEQTTNTTFTLILPQGEEMSGVPGVCVGAGSQVLPATLPPPDVPTTATSFASLPRQTLTCNIGTVGVGSSLQYPVTARVRAEVPNGAQLVLGPTDLMVTADDATATPTTPPPPITVSAAAHFDLSKTSVTDDPDSGYIFGPLTRSCVSNPAAACQFVQVPVLISGPAGGRGSTPLASPITFTEDLSPASLYPAGYSADPDWIAAGAGAPAKYGAALASPTCSGPLPNSPGDKIGGALTAANSVRDSGSVSCTQPGGPGTPVYVTIVNPDTTAYTYPSFASTPTGATLPANRAYVVSARILYEVPVAAIRDLGIASGGTYTFATTDYFTDFTAAGIDGLPNRAEPLVNNRRNIGYKLESPGGFNKWFAGIPGNPMNESPSEYSAGLPIMEGPPGAGSLHSGSIPAGRGQGVISQNYFALPSPVGPGAVSALTCDSWDNTKLWLKAANYPASSVPGTQYGQNYPSGGAAVWMSAAHTGIFDTNEQSQQFPTIVQYGTGTAGSGAGAECNDSSSPTGWVSDPSMLPGNDPVKAASGVYTGATRVRVYFQVPYTVAGALGTISIGQVVADSPGPNGTRAANWANVKYDYAGGTFANIRSNVVPWLLANSYNPADNAGVYGDRLTIVEDSVSLSKEVRTAFSGGFVTTTPQTSGGQTVDYRLSPAVVAGFPTTGSDDITVEDCVPVGQTFLVNSASTPPAEVQVGSSPLGAGIMCDAGETYVRWLLADQSINSAVTPIVYSVRINTTVAPGIQTNTAVVSSAGDANSSAAERTATAHVQINQPSGVAIDKSPLTPLVQVNRSGSAINEPLIWRIDFANLNAPGNPQDVDIIDVLPKNGTNGSSFAGTLTLSSIAVTAGSTVPQPVQVLYSRDPVLSSNPADPSNMNGTATTTWCDATSAGTAIIGTGACPTGRASVRGLRLRRPGSFTSGEVITADVTMLPAGNAKSDLYVNRVGGRSAGLLPVGPVDAPETVTASSFGHLVWWDLNRDGTQDAAEAGIPDVRIDVTGTDDLGNPVSVTATTDADGEYHVPSLRAGNYRATVDPASLPGNPRSVYDLDDGTGAADGDSGDFTLDLTQDRVDVNFGYRPGPSLRTTTSATTGPRGTQLSDRVTLAGTAGQNGTLAWTLLGPVTPATGQACTAVSYLDAPVAGAGATAVTGDGVYTVGPVTTGEAGCYSWVQTLSGSTYDADVTSRAGLPSETTLISALCVDGTTCVLDDGTQRPPAPGAQLAFTGFPVALSVQVALLLLLLGAGLAIATRRRRSSQVDGALRRDASPGP